MTVYLPPAGNLGDVTLILVLILFIWVITVRCLVALEWLVEWWMDL